MAAGAACARKAGSCRTLPLCAVSWAVAGRWRPRAGRPWVPARGRCGRTSPSAPGARSLCGNAGARKGASAGAAVGQGPCAQVSGGHRQQRPAEGPGGLWPCRDPRAPLAEQLWVRLAGGSGRCRGFLEVSHNGTWGRVCANGTSPGSAAAVCRQLGCGGRGWLSALSPQQPSRAWLAWVRCEDGARSLWGCPSAPWQLQSCGPGGDVRVDCEEDSDGIAETDTTPYPEGATSTGSSACSCLPHTRLAGLPSAHCLPVSPKVFPAEPPWQWLWGLCLCQLSCAWCWGRCCACPWVPWPCCCAVPVPGEKVGPSGWGQGQTRFGAPSLESSSEGGQG